MELLKMCRLGTAMVPFAISACCAGAVSFDPLPAHAAPVELREVTSRISPLGSGEHFWWTVATSPGDPKRVIVCTLLNSPATAQIFQAVMYGSTDGGDTWQQLKSTAGEPGESEVGCVLGRGRSAYFVMSSFAVLPANVVHGVYGSGTHTGRMHFSWSRDFGVTWHEQPLGTYACEAVLANDVKADPTHDTLFMVSEANCNPDGRRFTIIGDGGQTIVKDEMLPELPHTRARQHSAAEPQIVRLEDQTLGVTHVDTPPAAKHGESSPSTITFTRVDARGRPLAGPIVVAQLSRDVNFLHPKNFAWSTSIFRDPSMAIGTIPGSSKQRIYVVWHDLATGRLKILMSTSDDRGITWSNPYAIDDSADRALTSSDPMPTLPNVAVNPQGTVAVTWAEFTGRCWRIAVSADGGRHFDASSPLNPCSRRYVPINDTLNGHLEVIPPLYAASPSIRISDWRSIYWNVVTRGKGLAAAQDGSFFAAWSAIGTRDDGLHVTRVALRDQDHAALRRSAIVANATCCVAPRSQVWLEYTGLTYDEAMHEITVDAVLVRRRGLGGAWPVIFRIRSIDSVLGALHASNADNGLPGAGAAWVFDGPGQGLPRNAAASGDIGWLPRGEYEYSAPRTLHFHVDVTSGPVIAGAGGKLIDVDAEVLSTAKARNAARLLLPVTMRVRRTPLRDASCRGPTLSVIPSSARQRRGSQKSKGGFEVVGQAA